jgi:hypothetical protein
LKSSIRQTISITTTTTPSIPIANDCGRQSVTPTSQRIVGGVEAVPNS